MLCDPNSIIEGSLEAEIVRLRDHISDCMSRVIEASIKDGERLGIKQ
jgi:hypothetical protein